MRSRVISILIITLLCISVVFISVFALSNKKGEIQMDKSLIKLPKFKVAGNISIEETLYRRRSIRKFLNDSLNLEEISQILWAAQGITNTDGRRTSPSAGATYPLELYLISNKVEGLKDGVYQYIPDQHLLKVKKEGDLLKEIAGATYQVEMCSGAAGIIVITAIVERTVSVYGERGMRYIYMEAGHAAENLSLQGVALNIGSVLVGAFDDLRVIKALSLSKGEIPLYIIPIGKTDKYKK